MVDTTSDTTVNCINDDILLQQFEASIDDELHKLDFHNFCKRSASRTIERVQELDNKHREIKSIYCELGIRLAKFVTESDSPGGPSTPNHAKRTTKKIEERRDGNHVYTNKSHVVIGAETGADAKELPSCSKLNLSNLQEYEVPVDDTSSEHNISHSGTDTLVGKDNSYASLIDNNEGNNMVCKANIQNAPSPNSLGDYPVVQVHAVKPTNVTEHSASLLFSSMSITGVHEPTETINKHPNTMVSSDLANQDIKVSKSTDLPGQKAENKSFEFKVRSIVYAKPYGSDIWFEAELEKEITSNDKKQLKYQVRFLGGQGLRRKIPLKSIASKDSIEIDQVELGTRIVAGRPSDTVSNTISKKYKDIKNGNIRDFIFAGVVAELACEENNYRYLVFFDDGYAQYFYLKNLFLVIKPSHLVWNDVAVDTQAFIQEYLQEYPHRPLVCTTTNSVMQTEWDGEWWKSKVASVDASLVKIVFDVDDRSEWIYRGTTRLEALHNHFTQPNPAKKRKNEPKYANDEIYVDEKITHPQFGICKYSLTDPYGIQQRKEWNIPSVKLKRAPPQQSTTVHDSIRNNDREKDITPAKKLKVDGSKCARDSEQFSIISSQEVFDVLGALQMSPSVDTLPTISQHLNVSTAQTSLRLDAEHTEQ